MLWLRGKALYFIIPVVGFFGVCVSAWSMAVLLQCLVGTEWALWQSRAQAFLLD